MPAHASTRLMPTPSALASVHAPSNTVMRQRNLVFTASDNLHRGRRRREETRHVARPVRPSPEESEATKAEFADP